MIPKRLHNKNDSCISCGARLTTLGQNLGITIYQCRRCGLGMTEGCDQPEKYSAYHRDPVYIKAQDQFKNIFEKRVQIISKFKERGKVLEVGSSTGLFLSLLKERGWKVLGIEPSTTSSQVAIDRDVLTLTTTFELAQFPKNSFDLIIFNHVLEHMADPLKILKKAHTLLRSNGLVFIDVPNFASLAARLGSAGWQYILPKEHRWHFTPTALFMLLEKADFIPVYWEAHSGIWGYGNPARELWQSFRSGKKRFLWNILTALPTWILTKFKTGTGLSIVAQKC